MNIMSYLIYIFIFLLGLIIGSFINCLIYRMHEGKTIGGRSFCPKCKHQIAWYDNIPVLSWILLKAKCRHCKQKISWQYPVVEFIVGMLFVVSFYINIQYSILNIHSMFNVQYSIQLFRDFLVISVMIVIFLYDLKYYLILDKVTLPSIIVFSAINL